MRLLCALPIIMGFLTPGIHAGYISLDEEMRFESAAAQEHADYLAERRSAIPDILCPFQAPPKARVVIEEPDPWELTQNQWRRGITASVFWVGEKASERNPTPNHASAWDPNWQINYGGVDHPSSRSGYLPAGFKPRMNPFYVALPYDDLAPGDEPNAQAAHVVPWYWKAYKGPWSSTCKGKWLAIHYRGKVCYAQWEDCGPFHADDWQYVFKGHAPKPNPNGNAAIEVSPAVRDFLAIRSGYRVSWKFVQQDEVPNGPWSQW
jgi:hypothetical protein